MPSLLHELNCTCETRVLRLSQVLSFPQLCVLLALEGDPHAWKHAGLSCSDVQVFSLRVTSTANSLVTAAAVLYNAKVSAAAAAVGPTKMPLVACDSFMVVAF